MKSNTKKLTTLALFTTLALAIYAIEATLPTLVPIPGIKLGLANIITLIILRYMTAKDAFLVLLARILIAGFLFGQAISITYSLAGGFFCLIIMFLVNKFLQGHCLYITSIFGALAHQTGQLVVAILLTSSFAPLTYIPFFIISACITGLFTELCAHFAGKYMSKNLFRQLLQ